eukprot:m.109814 g.109814  ORF g.109814 m.109814 type:complete len:51 (+) comp37371_c0_seq21:1405-1557(+)
MLLSAPERFDLHDDSEDVFPFKYPGFNSAVPEGVEDVGDCPVIDLFFTAL